jgi:hypothetical protein
MHEAVVRIQLFSGGPVVSSAEDFNGPMDSMKGEDFWIIGDQSASWVLTCSIELVHCISYSSIQGHKLFLLNINTYHNSAPVQCWCSIPSAPPLYELKIEDATFWLCRLHTLRTCRLRCRTRQRMKFEMGQTQAIGMEDIVLNYSQSKPEEMRGGRKVDCWKLPRMIYECWRKRQTA